MMIKGIEVEVTSPDPKVAKLVEEKIMEDSKPTYELWFLGDRFNSRVKSRESLNELLVEAGKLIATGRQEGLNVGGVEVICVSANGNDIETVWDFNFAN